MNVMLKKIFPTTVAFDCEWVPDLPTLRRCYGVKENETDLELIKRSWADAGATEANPQPFLKVVLCRIVSICSVVRKQNGAEVDLRLVCLPGIGEGPTWTEAKILRSFLSATGKNAAQLVGFNCTGADLPAIVQRSLVNGVSAPEFAKRPDKPWEGADYFAAFTDQVFDVGKSVSMGRQMPTLHQAATACGIPGKLDVSGDQVLELWSAGKYEEIIQYNVFDALSTYLLWLRCALFSGLLDGDGHMAEQQHLLTLLETEIGRGRTFLGKYLEAWAPDLKK